MTNYDIKYEIDKLSHYVRTTKLQYAYDFTKKF